MTHRLLLVEQSATMCNVIEKHAQSLGYAVDTCLNYSQAVELLDKQFKKFGTDFSAVIFGWPTTPQNDAAAFARHLDSSDHKDIAVVVFSTDMRAETRAWVGGRDNAELLPWKEYQQLEKLLKQLIDTGTDAGTRIGTHIGTHGGTKMQNSTEGDVLPASANHQNIRILIVDASETIRLSLRDLLVNQGYQIYLASTHEEAIRCASESTIDIAIIDYYLSDTTGDELCREMLASADTRDIVCAVLTSTYSDHIIRRSLHAGAIECIFKNESSELFISRVDALSGFVRQQQELRNERQLLKEILGSIAGAMILTDSEQRVVYTNVLATNALGLKDESVLIGQHSSSFLEEGGPQAPGETLYAASWQLPEGRTVAVNYQHSLIKTGTYSLLHFAQQTVPVADADRAVMQQSHDPDTMAERLIKQFSLLDQCKPFLLQLLNYLNLARSSQSCGLQGQIPKVPMSDEGSQVSQNDSSMHVSLLVLDVLPADDAQAAQVREALFGLAAREHHVSALGEQRYAFLLRHAEESQAFVLTRNVMQQCLQAGAEDDEDNTLVCRGCVLSLTRNADHPVNALIQHVLRGMDLVNAGEPNQALLLDARRLLSAFPAVKSSLSEADSSGS